jgi:hypothetical protein
LRPASLFKYFGPNAAPFIHRPLLRFSPFASFNDPFEAAPLRLSESVLRKIGETMPLEAIEHALRLEFDDLHADDALNADEQARLFEEFRGMRFASAGGARELARQAFNGAARNPQAISEAIAFVKQQFGATCFSEDGVNSLMWAHYAASHNGFCVEFNAASQYFDQFASKEIPDPLVKVIYADALPDYSAEGARRADAFIVKPKAWAYEHEWRLVVQLVEVPGTLIQSEIGFVSPLDARVINSITLGARISDDLGRTIIEACGANGVSCYEISANSTAYDLKRVQILKG